MEKHYQQPRIFFFAVTISLSSWEIYICSPAWKTIIAIGEKKTSCERYCPAGRSALPGEDYLRGRHPQVQAVESKTSNGLSNFEETEFCCPILFVSESDCKDCYSLQSCLASAYKVTVLCINLDNRPLWAVTLVLGKIQCTWLDKRYALMFSFLLLLHVRSFHLRFGGGV